MMSAAIKGKSVDEVEELTSAVKAMMSIHEQSLDDDDDSGVLPDPPDVELGDLEELAGLLQLVRLRLDLLGEAPVQRFDLLAGAHCLFV